MECEREKELNRMVDKKKRWLVEKGAARKKHVWNVKERTKQSKKDLQGCGKRSCRV